MLKRSRALAVACCVSALAAVSAGCDGDDADRDRLTEERIQRERDEAEQIARQEEKLRQLEQALTGERKGRKREPGNPTPPGPTPPGPPPVPTGGTSCGDGVSVGPNTSCPFARVVRDAYYDSGEAGTVRAYSPVTGQTYLMSCSAGSPHVCYGGNNASVYFP